MSQTLNVQFSDSTESVVASYFGSPQDPKAFPNQGELVSSDARWKTFYGQMTAAGVIGLPEPS